MFKPPFRRRLEAAGVTTRQGKPSLTGLSLSSEQLAVRLFTSFAVRLTLRYSAVCGRRQGRCP